MHIAQYLDSTYLKKPSEAGISEEDFQKYAKIAEENCPVSVAFNFEITLSASLV